MASRAAKDGQESSADQAGARSGHATAGRYRLELAVPHDGKPDPLRDCQRRRVRPAFAATLSHGVYAFGPARRAIPAVSPSPRKILNRNRHNFGLGCVVQRQRWKSSRRR
jgi:hypothetical protein